LIERYYQDELQYLRELGGEFAQAHPALAHHLSGPGRDPDVERMLEGFAFLAARVRQKLDDEFPELAHGVMNLMWPHYLRPVPSLAILEFAPTFQAMRQSQRVLRGAEVQSVPVDGTPCRFRTAYDVPLHPLSLENAVLETRTSGQSRLRLAFRLWNQAKPETLALESLRLHLHGEPAVSCALYHHLCTHLEEARVSLSAAGEPARPLEIAPAGFGDDEALLPYAAASFPAYRHLQEYFALPQKFLFVDLLGLERLRELPVVDRFEVDLRFDRALPASLRVTREHLKLYCTPIVNLFPLEGDPIRLDRSQSEYRLRPSGRDPLHYEVYTVDRVTALSGGAGEKREIPDFYAFTAGLRRDQPCYYYTRLRSSVVDQRPDLYISFVDADSAPAFPEAETLSFGFTCTNRRLSEGLEIGDVHVPTDTSPSFVQFRNLGVPTRSAAPPLGGDLHWRLISHLTLNQLPLASVEALRGVLDLYNLQALHDAQAARANALRLEGIQAVHARAATTLAGGHLLRGTVVTVDVLEDHFASEGDLYLFASVLQEFIALHATLNGFVQLEVRGAQHGDTFSWPPRTGRDRL